MPKLAVRGSFLYGLRPVQRTSACETQSYSASSGAPPRWKALPTPHWRQSVLMALVHIYEKRVPHLWKKPGHITLLGLKYTQNYDSPDENNIGTGVHLLRPLSILRYNHLPWVSTATYQPSHVSSAVSAHRTTELTITGADSGVSEFDVLHAFCYNV